ncbi:LuxR C-terminal-related transcriptional regulator [Janthinobacterium agaricidamnosum]|uniref:Bacterial regulatory s, luxR family protein n=1 Tax=Janthinobacterium agaricidamnosum NBRC 102515 = DSM 9628 TaxID=1349767 RepID=W0VB54_9BURK|nr:LuxR C-terminal-related transcriptional regulator [Janthinobacterium agaricidamnosum]CDG84588.1 bacterial regulatory s, luxR family protein [Janthinobacterium agaricidamnosum NBRC 102515 = DSM 9628]
MYILENRPLMLAPREQGYLLRVIEAAPRAGGSHDLFLWTQGEFQALLPHQIMVCLHFDGAGQVRHAACLHGGTADAALLGRLADPQRGLAPRLARHHRCSGGAAPPPALLEELRHTGLQHMMGRGSDDLPGGASFFALFGLPQAPAAQQLYLLDLLLPYLHMALLRLAGGPAAAPAMRAASVREVEILRWVKEGKSNHEIGAILGISGWTVKSHLQRIYKLLEVANRTQAVSRGIALRWFEQHAA